MKRRTLVQAATLAVPWPGVFHAPCLHAQQADRVRRIGWLIPALESTPLGRAMRETLHTALRELGWVVGKNLVIEGRFAGPYPQRQRDVAAELKALPVALIITVGTIASRSVRRANWTAPSRAQGAAH